jgi:hypothetical protein
LIASLQGLPAGKAGGVMNKESHFKHAFDSFSYAVVSECYDEVMRPKEEVNIGRSSGIISVPL